MKARNVCALLFNAVMGMVLACMLGVSPVYGAVVAAGGSVLLGGFMPSGGLLAGILTEVWTGELIKKLRSADQASFLDGIPDYSQYSENDVIHLIDAGADPDVLINNTTYPIPVQALTDADVAIKLDKFQTKATPVTDDELYALSYDKMSSVKERHGSAILEAKYGKAIHALAPQTNSAKTPVIKTTGGVEGGAEAGRKMITRADIIALKKKFDMMQVPLEGRRLVLCPDHVNDLLLVDQAFRDQYYNYTTGKISSLYGFEVHEYVNNPYFGANGTKVVYGTAPAAGEYQVSVAFYTKRAFKASGSTRMYYREARMSPEYQRSMINFRHYYIVLPKKQEAMAAIMSDTATGE
jgi:hypothetical protein